MAVCINKNSLIYQTLKQRSGISEFILESVCRDFLEKHGRFPYLDEIPGSNSESYLKDRLKVTEHGGAKITNILEVAGKGTVEEAIVSINNQFRDLETTIVPINKEALVDIVHRPTDDNFDNWSEEDEILARAPRDNSGNLLAPNGKVSNLTEKQYAQVRTKAFKEWFGDWINSSIIPTSFMPKRGWTIGKVIDNPTDAANICDNTQIKVLNHIIQQFGKPNSRGKFYAKPVIIWAKSPINNLQIHHSTVAVRINGDIYLYDMPQSEYIKYNSENNGTVIKEYSPRLIKYTEENLKNLYGTSNENIHINDEPILDNNIIELPLSNASKVVDENGEPLVVYHGSVAKFNTFDKNKNKKGYWEDANGNTIEFDTNNTFFFSNNKAVAKSYTLLNELTGAEISDSGINTINKYLESIKYITKLTSNDIIEKYTDVINDVIKDISTYKETTIYKSLKEENIRGSLVLHKGKLMLKKSTLEGLVYTELPSKFFKDAIDSIKLVLDKRIESYSKPRTTWEGKQIPRIDINEDVYPVFLNIRDPFSFDYEGATINSKYKEKYPIEYINARQVAKAIKEKSDGVIYNNIADPYLGDTYGVFNPNQIKSATSNSGSFNRLSGNIYDVEPNDYLVLNNTLQKLAKLYGINFNTVTDAELNSERWADLMPESRLVNAFIYDGQIYINVDRANLDAPLHEMLHIFVGSMRFTNPNIYQEFIQLAEKFPNYDKLASKFSGKTRNDINEEIFITEISKYLTGQKSALTGVDEKLMYEVSYNVHRVLDSVLMGTDSSKTITDDRLYTLSLKDLASELNSAIMTNNMPPLRDSELHRTLNNMKSDLMREGKLKEICD